MQTLLLDLDNTIYPVHSIGEKLFAPLIRLLKSPEYGLTSLTLSESEEQIMRIPFQKVAEQFNFPPELTEKAIELLRNLTYDEPISYYEDYELIRQLENRKFLLTTGFRKLQESKIQALRIKQDFTEIFIIDPENSSMTKKDAMIRIMDKYQLSAADLLVIGDDPESEIKAARELNILSFLLDSNNVHPESIADYKGRRLNEVLNYLK